MSAPIALIAGSQGLPVEIDLQPEPSMTTPYGDVSGTVGRGRMGATEVLVLSRHGDQQAIAPHDINYRANIWALKNWGVQEVIATNCVGAINRAFTPGTVVVPDQLIDYTWGREHSFYEPGKLDHVAFGEPYDGELIEQLGSALVTCGLPKFVHATYACTQGPRFETRAEINKLAQDGCDLVGMTAMPEAGLAREAGLRYANLSLVVNPAAGRGAEIDFPSIVEIGRVGAETMVSIIIQLFELGH